jgi:hypothetical protein
MRIIFFTIGFALIASACSVNKDTPTVSKDMDPKRSNVELQFLTREGCQNTARMLENLNAAIATGKVSATYTLIQQDGLSRDDPRSGYPTPTILLDDRDIFGLSVPQQPFPEPS